MSVRIADTAALEILDSRGNPTLEVTVTIDGGLRATAGVPSGASTGENEAVELRDGDAARYAGKGVRRAVAHVNGAIREALRGADVTRQRDIDALLCGLDGTPNKSNLGANAIIGVSMACARAAALSSGVPLYTYLGGARSGRLPMPMVNVINGGMHADNHLDFQEFMMVPVGAPTFSEGLRYVAESFHALKALLRESGQPTGVGDEGGFSPAVEGNARPCQLIVAAIERAGYRPGEDIAIALDPAASSFHEGGLYRLSRSGEGDRTSAQMTALYESWIRKYPIVSIEDGLGESDWAGWREHTAALGGRVQIVGDDNLVTNTRFIERGIREKTCNAALIKLNQIGTVTETMDAIALCRQAGWRYVVSHRSGETCDAFIADFAVAMGGGQIKAGSVCRGERLAKYNRLLEIELELGSAARFGPEVPLKAGTST